MQKTTIEWVRNPDGSPGFTWNPLTGCLGPNGDGVHCEYCYARRLANGRLRGLYLANANTSGLRNDLVSVEEYGLQRTDPFYPRFWPRRLGDPLKVAKPAGIFCCDMSDLFGIGIPSWWTGSVMNFIEAFPHHRFYILTKQPQNLAKFSPFPDNCWVGVSVTNETQAIDAVTPLMQIQASVKFISHEPLLGRIRWTHLEGLVNWLILGGKSGKQPFYPNESWIQEIEEAADRAGIAVFEKNNLRKDWGDRQPRQEMP